MARTYLNDALKARAEKAQKVDDGEVHLDDVSRVKVLSPGRQVFKRFIRNRLAVFGSVLLITMFVFSFLGPLFYAYGQKQIFYKFDNQNVNYGMAKENTAFNGYTGDGSVEIERAVINAVNSNVKKMIAAGQDRMVVIGENGAYLLSRQADEVYILSANAISENGEIVNIDGNGNRLASAFYGHERVIFVVGVNKVVPDLPAAIDRARNVASPLNARRLQRKTPCALSEPMRCHDCASPERICSGMSILYGRMWSTPQMDVILINEALGY